MKSQSFTKDQYDLLDAAYQFFNDKLFNNQLPECMIVLHRKKSSRGYFHAERYVQKSEIESKGKKKKLNFIDELALNPDEFDRTDIAILSTEVHEMAHVWRHRCSGKEPSKGGYHDKLWAKKMVEIGLTPKAIAKDGSLTDKQTGQKVTHEIMKNGLFERHCLSFLKGRSIKLSSFELPKTSQQSKKNKIKYSCSCGNNIWGKPGLSVQCNECKESFMEE